VGEKHSAAEAAARHPRCILHSTSSDVQPPSAATRAWHPFSEILKRRSSDLVPIQTDPRTHRIDGERGGWRKQYPMTKTKPLKRLKLLSPRQGKGANPGSQFNVHKPAQDPRRRHCWVEKRRNCDQRSSIHRLRTLPHRAIPNFDGGFARRTSGR
jgi:hypothetical protein